VRDSGLEWVLIRPPRFTSQLRGQLRVLRPGDKGRVGHVSRHDLARVLIDAAERPDYLYRRSSWAHSPGFPRVCRDRGRSGADCRDLSSLHHDRPSMDSRPIGGYALLRASASRPPSAIGLGADAAATSASRASAGRGSCALSDGPVNRAWSDLGPGMRSSLPTMDAGSQWDDTARTRRTSSSARRCGAPLEACRLPPVSAKLDADMLAGLRAGKLLAGVRGCGQPASTRWPGRSRRLSELAVEFGEHIEALNVSPLISRPEGAVAVDALAVPRRTTPPVS
jgi:hypothetical protein